MADYIERDAAINAILDAKRVGNTAFADVYDALARVKAIPQADVRPARHGRLLNPNPYGECSLCGYLIDIRDSFTFCPNCGAYMR